MLKTLKAFGGLAVAMALAITAAQGQETRTLKFAHVFPATHYLWEHGGKVFADSVATATSGRIKFEVYPTAQLGKDGIKLLKSGLAETALLVPSYTPEAMALTSVSELPGFYSHACEATEMLWSIAKDGAILNEKEYAPQGIHVLFVSILPPYKVMTVSKPVTKLEEMGGLKIRANGVAMDKTVRNLGATPIRVTAAELFDSLSRGTVDGGFWPYHSTPTYNLEKVFKYSVEGAQLGSGSVVFAISDEVWKSLSAEDQAALTTAAGNAQKQLCEWLDEEEAKVRDMMVKENGLQITTLSPGDSAVWQAKASTVADEWAAELDSSGRPGAEMLSAFKATAKK